MTNNLSSGRHRVARCAALVGAAQRLARELGVPPVVGTVLASRGFGDPAAARDFLECRNIFPTHSSSETWQRSSTSSQTWRSAADAYGSWRHEPRHHRDRAYGLGAQGVGVEAESYLPIDSPKDTGCHGVRWRASRHGDQAFSSRSIAGSTIRMRWLSPENWAWKSS